MKIVLIGAGNVATHLGVGLKRAGHEILQVYSQSISSSSTLAKKLRTASITDLKKITPAADLYLVSVSDHAIPAIIRSFPVKDKTVVHTSGSVGIKVFGKRFSNYGVLYPLQTFSKERAINLKEVPFLIEGNSTASFKLIEKVAYSLSPFVFETDSATRKTVHLSAVLTNNFANHLFVQAEKMLSKKGIPFPLLGPLLHETVIKAIKLTPSASQTGPAKRGDTEIINEHLKMLKGNPGLQKIYQLMSESIEKESAPKL